MGTKIFINLPVKDLNRSIAFYTRLNYKFNPQFTNESGTCMIVGEDIFVMLLVEKFFKTFIPKGMADSETSNEAILAIMLESREKVDEMVKTALQAGGKPSMPPQDQPMMYGWGFQDPDGHLWEVGWMDPKAIL
jgi:predicted lactoylglutathione lyase